MLKGFRGKISNSETILCTALASKNYLIKSVILTNNSSSTNIAFDLYVTSGSEDYLLAPKGLSLFAGETFISDVEVFINAKDSLRAIITTGSGSLLDYNVLAEIMNK
jgi:hypothetical protein